MSILDNLPPPTNTEGWPLIRSLPSPTNPMAVARDLVNLTKRAGTICWWRGDFYRWVGTHWVVWADEEVKAWLYQETETAVYETTDRDGKPKTAQWAPNRKKIGDLLDALAHGVVLRRGDLETDDGIGRVAFANGVLDLESMELLHHAPDRFNLHCLRFEFDPEAGCPRWTRFLNEVLEGDTARIALLQEWFGYVLCGGTELQKILSMFGPKRCGKGTVMRILTALLGPVYVAAPPTLDSLAGTFGQEKLIGTRLAVLGDVQWVGSRLGEVVGILLSISGEDFQSIHRKNRTDWKGRLGTRFMIAGNDRPKFSNASTALAGRMEQLQFRVSFYGREDAGLEKRLVAELSGIFNWALGGWRRLLRNGKRFTQSDLGLAAKEEVERSASPVTAFVRDECVLRIEAKVELDELHRAYVRWRTAERLEGTVPVAAFSRNLQSSFPMVATARVGSARTGRTQVAHGIRLRVDDTEPFELAFVDQVPDQADQADQDERFDLGLGVNPGQELYGPGGPGGPGISGVYRLEDSDSSERTSSDPYEHPPKTRVQTDVGICLVPSGPPGPQSQRKPLTSANSTPDPDQVPGPDPGPGPVQGETTPISSNGRSGGPPSPPDPRSDTQERRSLLRNAPCPTCDVLADFGHAANCPEAAAPW
jgi:putative DNA primase/helicase